MPSKALLVSLAAEGGDGGWNAKKKVESHDRLRRRKICRNSVISHVRAIILPLQPVLDKKVGGRVLLELLL